MVIKEMKIANVVTATSQAAMAIVRDNEGERESKRCKAAELAVKLLTNQLIIQ